MCDATHTISENTCQAFRFKSCSDMVLNRLYSGPYHGTERMNLLDSGTHWQLQGLQSFANGNQLLE